MPADHEANGLPHPEHFRNSTVVPVPLVASFINQRVSTVASVQLVRPSGELVLQSSVMSFHVKACLEAGPGSAATPGHAFQIMDFLCPAMVLNEAGYVREAAAKLRATGPVETWRVTPFHQLIMYAIGCSSESASTPAMRLPHCATC